MKIRKLALITSLIAMSFTSYAADRSSSTLLYEMNKAMSQEKTAVTTDSSVSFKMTESESKQVLKNGISSETAQINWRCHGTISNTLYVTDLKPNDILQLYTLDQTCADAYFKATTKNLSNARFTLFLTDSNVTRIIDQSAYGISTTLPVGTYQLFIQNTSTSQRGDAHVDISRSF